MSSALVTVTPDDQLYNEVSRMWEQFRIANLNVRYYGSLAQKRKTQSTCGQIAIAVLSLAALVIFADADLRTIYGFGAAIMSGLATVTAGALPFLGWDEDGRKYSFLNRSYQITENQIRDTLVQLRRAGTLTPELLGKSEMVLDSMSRLQGLDEEEYSAKALTKKDALTQEVNDSFPADYVWNNL